MIGIDEKSWANSIKSKIEDKQEKHWQIHIAIVKFYLLDSCRTLKLCHTVVLFKGFIFFSVNNFTSSNSTASYLLYTLITSVPILAVFTSVRKKLVVLSISRDHNKKH